MKREIKELKRLARGNLQGNFFEFIRVFIFCNIVVSLLEMPFSMMTNDITFSTQNIIYYIAIILIGIASVVLTAGQYRLHLQLARTGKCHLMEVFDPAKNHANRFILTESILWIIELCCLLPIIVSASMIYFFDDVQIHLLALALSLVGCILTILYNIAFGLTYFVLIDQQELSMLSALKYTLKLMKTHKRRFFYMQLSFSGMYLLVGLTFGIGLLWVQPYIVQTTTLFYMDVTGELDEVLERKRKKEPSPAPVIFDSYA